MSDSLIGPPQYPALFYSSDTASLKAQRKHFYLFGIQLTIFAVVAVLGVGVSFLSAPLWRVGYGIVTVLLATGLLLQRELRTRQYERVWFECRAVAESVKSAAWRYMMAAPPYVLALEDQEADRQFIVDLRRIRKAESSVEVHIAGNVPIGTATELSCDMKKTRASSVLDRRTFYARWRLQDQLEWYARRAKSCRAAGERWSWGIAVVQAVALIVAVIQISVGAPHVNLIGLAMTGASGLVAWSQGRRFDELAHAYALAAQEIRELASLIPSDSDDAKFQEFVQQVEEAISREHTMWYARRSGGFGSGGLREG